MGHHQVSRSRPVPHFCARFSCAEVGRRMHGALLPTSDPRKEPAGQIWGTIRFLVPARCPISAHVFRAQKWEEECMEPFFPHLTRAKNPRVRYGAPSGFSFPPGAPFLRTFLVRRSGKKNAWSPSSHI